MLRFPPRRVLVAVDFSRVSLLAWRAGAEIAARFGATLEAVWCLEPAVTEMTGLRSLSRPPGYRREALEELRRRLGAGARLHVVPGDPAKALCRLARDRACDLLVLGSHRRKGFARLVMGSVSEAVVRGASCPVLVVNRPWREPRWILAPVHAAAYARSGLLAAGGVARGFGARLSLLHVLVETESGAGAAEMLRRRAADLPPLLARAVRPVRELRRGDPVREILLAEKGRDLVVLVAHRRSILGDLVLGTTVERVLRHSRAPVLAIPARD